MVIDPKYEQIKTYKIIKRDGREEPFYMEKLIKVLKWATESVKEGEMYIEKLLNEVALKIVDKMRIQDLYDALIEIAVSKISALAPAWDDIAKYLYLLKIYKEQFNLKRIGTYPQLQKFLNRGVEKGVYDPKVIAEFTEEELDDLSSYIEPDRDLLFNYKGLRLFFDKYCKNSNGKTKTKKVELPQVTYMVAAMQSHFNEPHSTKAEIKARLKNIMKCYNILSTHKVTFSTPRLSYGLQLNPQFASCVLITPDDDTNSLNQTDDFAALYSKNSGGIAIDVSYIRSAGSSIANNSGKSDGPIPFIKRYEQTISSFNQSGRRMGAVIIYFPWWHMDSPDMIMLKDSGGNEENRARKCKYGMKIHRILLERTLKDEWITLFDPKETAILNELNGEEFNKKYIEFENTATIRSKKMKARELMELFFKVRVETGNLYAAFMDNINEQELTGRTIGMSNLCCFTGDTEILTSKGYRPIKELSGKTVLCWNGYEWSLTPIFKTNKAAKVYRVYFDIYPEDSPKEWTFATTVRVTGYHKWFIQNKKGEVEKIDTHHLKQLIEKSNKKVKVRTPNYYNPSYDIKNGLFAYGESCFAVFTKIEECKELEETYCGNEPINHSLIAKGVLSGNCEVTVPSRRPNLISEKYYKNQDGKYEIHTIRENGEIGLCNLSSINALQWFYMEDRDKNDLIANLLRGMDNAIDSQFYPVAEAAWPNKAYRPIGIGITDYANLLAFEKIKYSDDKAFQFTNDLMEDIYLRIYYQSMMLAKERGAFDGFKHSNWAKGLTPYHLSRFRKENPLNIEYKNDKLWNELSNKIKQNGVRFSLHSAIPPSACQTLDSEIIYRGKNGEATSITMEEFIRECGISDKLRDQIQDSESRGWVNLEKPIYIPIEIYGETKIIRKLGQVEKLFYNGKSVPLYKITFSDGFIGTYTGNHMFFPVFNNRIHKKSVSNLKIGDKFEIHHLGKYVTIENIEIVEPTHTWSFEVNRDNVYLLGNGILSKNTSGKVTNATEACEPIMDLFYVETGTHILPTIVKGKGETRNFYEKCWDISPKRILELAAIRQVYLDQSQSFNQYYVKPDSVTDLFLDLMYAEKLGLKSVYYLKTPKLETDLECSSCSV